MVQYKPMFPLCSKPSLCSTLHWNKPNIKRWSCFITFSTGMENRNVNLQIYDYIIYIYLYSIISSLFYYFITYLYINVKKIKNLKMSALRYFIKFCIVMPWYFDRNGHIRKTLKNYSIIKSIQYYSINTSISSFWSVLWCHGA